MLQLLIDQPLLLLFVVAAIGYPLGRIKFRGCSLGIAAVLFVGLAFGALDPRIKLPEIIYQLGLIVFVYAVGISSGPAFAAALRRKGIRDNALTLAILLFAALLTVGLARVFGLQPALAVGVFTGSLTNTPALASVIEQLKMLAPAATREQLLAAPVIGYSVTYPIGVIGVIVAIVLAERFWQIDYTHEAQQLHDSGRYERLENRTIRVTRTDAGRETVQELERHDWDVLVGRVKHREQLLLANGNTRLAQNDLVSLIGSKGDLELATTYLGEQAEEHLEQDRHDFDYRRIFLSNPDVAGHTLSELALPERFGAMVTRVRRGDSDMLAHGDTVLELGDRVRVVAPPERMPALSSFFGDSYRALGEIDILTFNLGLTLGLLLGLVPIPFPGGATVKLGIAGGPLVVALVLSALKRTGPFVWGLPYSANLTLRQLGLVLFLAGVGTRAGYAFLSTLSSGGLILLLAGACITCTVALVMLWVGYRVLRIPMSLLLGMLAGLQTQPAVLGFALERTDNDLPNVGYATVYPIATIAKIIIVQMMLVLLFAG